MTCQRCPPVLFAGVVGALLGCSTARDVDSITPDYCFDCHGDRSNDNAAPPPAFWREPAAGDAHQQHLAESPWHARVVCTDCHRVPEEVLAPGHVDSELPAELTWGARATADGAVPALVAGSCDGAYCHGATLLPGGTNTAPEWRRVDGSQAACGTCHGLPPDRPHPAASGASCAPCHAFTARDPDDPSSHVDGVVEVAACGDSGCHDVPPDDRAHRVHFGERAPPPRADYGDLRTVVDFAPDGAPYYAFGCGYCHPLDDLRHGDGAVDVELYDPSAPAGTIKARQPATARYDGTRCSDVYCHSSGQEEPVYAATPTWPDGAFTGPRCASCHSNPPVYPTGGAGTPTANTHVVLADSGSELGHFGGFPGPFHGSRHGSPPRVSAPITCQTCHYDTTDPDATGPGGFYYLDTTGSYDAGGTLDYDCTDCHTGSGSAPATGEGGVRTAAHVNGRRDVVFDPRTSIPPGVGGLPPAPNRPSYPYWFRHAPAELPPDSTVDGGTWSLHLAGAAYDPATKTCTHVPCHLKQSFGGSHDPLRWGTTPVGIATCSACHQD